ncbi:MAG: 6-bladed beta-propeller [Thermoleophilia bacterium]
MEITRTKVKLIILIVLILLLALVAFFVIKKWGENKPIASASFNLVFSIEDVRTPLGVATNADGTIYVSDTGNSRVGVYDKNGELQYHILNVEEGDKSIPFRSPYGIVVDDVRNKVYVCDYAVRVMDKGGKFLYDLIPPPEAVSQASGESSPRPNEVALYQDRVYVTSRDGIYIFSAEDGKFLTHWGSRGKQIGQYDFPNGITVDPDNGNIYVVDTNNWRVVALANDGTVRWVLGNLYDEDIPSPFHLPRSIALGPDGLLYISDIPDRIVALDQEGNLKSLLGERGTEENKFNFPEGLTFAADRRILVADRENNRVQVWRLTDRLPVPSQPDVEKFKKALKVIDTTPPEITNLSPVGVVDNKSVNITAGYSDDISGVNESSVEVKLDSVPIKGCNIAKDFVSCPARDLTDGEHDVTVSLKDKAGNPSQTSGFFKVDTTPPKITIIGPNGVIKNNSVDIVASFLDISSGTNNESISVSVDGAEISDCAVGAFAVSCAVADLTAGNHSFTVNVNDNIGNHGSTSGSFTVVLDQTQR